MQSFGGSAPRGEKLNPRVYKPLLTSSRHRRANDTRFASNRVFTEGNDPMYKSQLRGEASLFNNRREVNTGSPPPQNRNDEERENEELKRILRQTRTDLQLILESNKMLVGKLRRVSHSKRQLHTDVYNGLSHRGNLMSASSVNLAMR